MKAYRWQAYQDISRRDSFAVNDAGAINHAHDEARDVVFAIGVESGHLGSLAADQGAARFFAAARAPFDHRRDYVRHEPPGCDVIEKEKRPRALNQYVVNAMADQIVAYRVMNACDKSYA